MNIFRFGFLRILPLFKYLACFIICLCPLFLNLSQFCVRFIVETPDKLFPGWMVGESNGWMDERTKDGIL